MFCHHSILGMFIVKNMLAVYRSCLNHSGSTKGMPYCIVVEEDTNMLSNLTQQVHIK